MTTQQATAPDDPEVTQLIPFDESQSTPPPSTANKGISIADVEYLVTVQGLSRTETAKVLGVSRQAIDYHCEKHEIISPNKFKLFQKHRADILALRSLKINNALANDDLKSMSPYQLVGMDSVTYAQEVEQRKYITPSNDYETLDKSSDELQAALDALDDG